MTNRLQQQIRFLMEIDKLKTILRRSYLLHEARRENAAEHSWHLALMAITLAEHAADTIDPLKVIKMMVIHDIVEIDAGDTFCYDTDGQTRKMNLESRAAERIFGILPRDQAYELRRLWEEFEARQTPEARFAASLDRLMPLIHNYHTEGKAWKKYKITEAQVIERNRHIAEGAPALWEFAKALIADSVTLGYLKPSKVVALA